MKTLFAILFVIALARAAFVNLPDNTVYRHSPSGLKVKTVMDMKTVDTHQAIKMQVNSVEYIKEANDVGWKQVCLDPCAGDVEAPFAQGSPHKLAYEKMKLKVPGYKEHQRNMGKPDTTLQCCTLIMATEWTIHWTDPSDLYTPGNGVYQSMFTQWLINPDVEYFNSCPAAAGAYGMPDTRLAFSENADAVSTSKLSFADGFKSLFGMEPKKRFSYTSSHIDNTVERSYYYGDDLVFYNKYAYNPLPVEQGGELMPGFPETCMYYVNENGEPAVLTFQTGPWIMHELSYEGGDIIQCNQINGLRAKDQYCMEGGVFLQVMLFSDPVNDKYSMGMPESYKLEVV